MFASLIFRIFAPRLKAVLPDVPVIHIFRGLVPFIAVDLMRLAYVEVLADERKTTTTAFLLRALRWFRSNGIRTERVMTDNGSAYRSRQFHKALHWLGIRHIYTRPYTPKRTGKAERFIQTLLREWAYGLAHPSPAARNDDLPRWLDWFNRSRSHSALKGLAPISAVNNLMRNHS